LEEIEFYQRGMSVVKYREHSSDVFFKSYYVLKKYLKEPGQKLVFDILGSAIHKDNQDPYIVESGIYILKGVLDDFEKSKEPTEISEFLRNSIEMVL
jgi:hypothetical protein